MKTMNALIKRNTKLFFKDKGLFFVSLITPLILLVLYITFLGNVYRNSFVANFPQQVQIPNKVINGLVGGQLFSSLLAVCCVTVAFCSNMLMVQDKISGARQDFLISPVKKSKLSISYYIASLQSTLIICFFAMFCSFVYVACTGWYLSFVDVLALFLDVFLLVMFGTALSSIINHFLSSQGQISAVGSIVSSCYGFICGAYMPISNFSAGLKNVVSLLPGTYGTGLLRNHALMGVFKQLQKLGLSESTIKNIKDSIDCNIYFFGEKVSIFAMYLIVAVCVILLIVVYVLINVLQGKKRMRKSKN